MTVLLCTMYYDMIDLLVGHLGLTSRFNQHNPKGLELIVTDSCRILHTVTESLLSIPSSAGSVILEVDGSTRKTAVMASATGQQVSRWWRFSDNAI